MQTLVYRFDILIILITVKVLCMYQSQSKFTYKNENVCRLVCLSFAYDSTTSSFSIKIT